MSERCQLEEASPATVINSVPSACIHQTPGKAAVKLLIALAQEHVSETMSCRPNARQGSCMFSYCGAYTVHVPRNVHEVWDEKQQKHCAPFAAWIHQPQLLQSIIHVVW